MYLADQSHDDYLITGIDAATGRALWRSTYDEARRDGYPIDMAVSADVSADGSRVFVTGFPAIYFPRCPGSATIALDGADGRRVWADATEHGAAEIPAGADGAVYLAASSGKRFLTFRSTLRRREGPPGAGPSVSRRSRSRRLSSSGQGSVGNLAD
jgi:hypothetical protein